MPLIRETRRARPRGRLSIPLAALGIWLLGTGVAGMLPGLHDCQAGDWPRWRGPQGTGVSEEMHLPVTWGPQANVRWKRAIDGEGFSSPIVSGGAIYLTAAFEQGLRRAVYCLDRRTGTLRWRRIIDDPDPEVASAMTGHAAATPVSDGRRVVAFFGRAGLVCYSGDGELLWRLDLGRFESELGLATSPIIEGDQVLLVCDHDGNRFGSFDSCLRSFDLQTGKPNWKTDRPGLYRSFSTPVVVPTADGSRELVVDAQDQLRGYDPANGAPLWQIDTAGGWVAPSPVFAQGLVFACSGRSGPLMAVRPGGKGNVTKTHLVWHHRGAGPYVCSPVVYQEHLYVHDEAGVLSCYEAATGRRVYRQRLPGKFTSSSVAGDGKVYLTNEEATTYVIKAGGQFELLATNRLDAYCLASPAISDGEILVRTRGHLYCIAAGP